LIGLLACKKSASASIIHKGSHLEHLQTKNRYTSG